MLCTIDTIFGDDASNIRASRKQGSICEHRAAAAQEGLTEREGRLDGTADLRRNDNDERGLPDPEQEDHCKGVQRTMIAKSVRSFFQNTQRLQ